MTNPIVNLLARIASPRMVMCSALLCAAVSCRHARVESTRETLPPDPLGTLAPALHGARLPEQLDDSTYWRMVREFSEPSGYFLSENFVSNEMGLQQVISRLRPLMPPGGVYLGVGPEQNFTYLAALKPRIAFIVDIRRQNLLQHLWYKAVFEMSPTRAAFLAKLFARPLPDDVMRNANDALPADSLIALLERTPRDSLAFARTFRDVRTALVSRHHFTLDSSDLATLHYIDSVFFLAGPSLNYSSGQGGYGNNYRRMPTFAMIAGTTDENGRNLGFLGTDSAYRVVRDMHRRNLIVPVVGNFSGPHALRAVGAWLAERDARVGAFYVSNVEQYLFRQGDDWNRFYGNVAMLPTDDDSRFIRSTSGGMRSFGGSSSGSPVMMMTQLLSPVGPLVEAAKMGTLGGYGDVISRSR